MPPGGYRIGPNPCVTKLHQIPYEMLGGRSTPDTDYQENWEPNLVNATFTALVSWTNADTFVLDMLGSHYQHGRYIQRNNPEPHPYLPNLYCVGCKLTGNYGVLEREPTTNAVVYEYSSYVCTFAAFLYDVLNDEDILEAGFYDELLRYVERRSKNIGQSLSTSGQFEYASDASGAAVDWFSAAGSITGATNSPPLLIKITSEAHGLTTGKVITITEVGGNTAANGTWTVTVLDANNFNIPAVGNGDYTGGGIWTCRGASTLAIPTPPAIMVPYRELRYVWRYVPGPINNLMNVCDALYGTLNGPLLTSLPFDDLYAPETCMYMGAEYDPVPSTPAGNQLFTVTHKINYFPLGWNSVYRPNVAQGFWDRARNRATGAPPYGLKDFSVLFQL